MKPPRFEYHRPTTVDEALELLAGSGGGARVLAGGQSLVPMMNIRLASPEALIDINRVEGISGISYQPGIFVIGALTRQRALETSPELAGRQPLLREAVSHIGHVTIRNRGTIGGSLAHADPAAELGVVGRALGVEIRARSSGGDRMIPADQFFLGAFTTSLREDEMITEVHVPERAPDSGWAFQEIARSHGNFAIAAVSAVVRLTDGTISEARLALGGVGPTPVRAAEAEALLVGRKPTDAAFREASEAVDGVIDPFDDVQASGEYRRKVARVLVSRTLEVAAGRAAGRETP